MNILIVLAHPDPGSFNHALAHAMRDELCARGACVVFHDLCAEGFEPLLTKQEIPQSAPVPPQVEQHCADLQAADGIIIVHPNWWGQPPAILKGWVDRVVRPGVAYRFDEGDNGEGIPIGLLKARAALVINTSNTPDAREQSAFGDPLERIWRDCIFHLCGVRNFQRRMFNVIVTSTPEQRRTWIDEARQLATGFFERGAARVRSTGPKAELQR
ncbi:MAG TPA: NAD(P)H-dependent oxidoreductase [Verrucomicrobiae bacterium]